MLLSIANRISLYLMKENPDQDPIEACTYGIDIVLYTLISTAGLTLIGSLFLTFGQTALLIAVYYANQMSGGGYHASTHTKCFFSMTAGLLFSAFVIWFINGSLSIVIPTSCTALLVLWKYPVILHKNKQYLSTIMTVMKNRARLISGLSFFITVALYFNPALSEAAMMGMIMAAVSRLSSIVLTRASKAPAP
ncbi:MAG: accessory gene regulator B family protein [Clostridia bacterium]|nr:accessory gene regulator B family protein [Clostridia bacterium]